MPVIIVGNEEYRIRKFLIDRFNEPLHIVVGTKSLADKLIMPDCENCEEVVNTTNFFISDDLINLSAEEICNKHLGEPINLVKEIK